MSIFVWIVVGVVAGALAKAVMPGKEDGGWLGDLVLGLIGALLGGFLFQAMLGYSYDGWLGSTFVAFVGAVLLLSIGRALSKGGRQAV
jgi:uncharacterized membrane protein YeaQ/YmgE (transglycosylase-associated protein family)